MTDIMRISDGKWLRAIAKSQVPSIDEQVHDQLTPTEHGTATTATLVRAVWSLPQSAEEEIMHHTAKTHTSRGQQIVHDVEIASQRFLSVLERETGRRLGALCRQLNFASRHEVHGLLRRVAQLEQQLTRSDEPVDYELGDSMKASTIPAQTTSLRRYEELLWDEV